MASINLTAKEIVRLQAAGEDAQIYDGKVRGLVLRVRGGGRLSWSAVYTAGGKKQRVTLKGADAASLDAARKAATRIINEAHAGRDHAAERRGRRQTRTVNELLDDYLASPRFGELRSKRGPICSFNAHVRPALGSRVAATLTRGDIAALFDKIAMGDATTKARPGAARHAQAHLGAAITWAVDRGLLTASPMLGLRKPGASVARDRVLSIDELRTMLDKLPGAPLATPTQRIVALLAYTGGRAGEIAALRRNEVNLESKTIELSPSRTKNGKAFTIPLSDPALQIVSDAMKDSEYSDFVFPSPIDWRKPIESNAVSKALLRAQTYFDIPHWTAHDLRRSIATNLSDNDIQPHIIEVILNHVSGGITRKHYNFATYAVEHRKGLNLWADLLGIL